MNKKSVERARHGMFLLAGLFYVAIAHAQSSTGAVWALEASAGSAADVHSARALLIGNANGMNYPFLIEAQCEPQRLVLLVSGVGLASPTLASAIYVQLDHRMVERMELTSASAAGKSGAIEMTFPIAEEVFDAKVMRLQIGLRGAQALVNFMPQEASFKAFAAACGKQPETAIYDRHPATVHPRPLPPTKIGSGVQSFSGPYEEFAKALDGLIIKAANKAGVPPERSWAFEEKEILDAARLCAGVTSQMAESVTFHGRADLSLLDGGYKVCGQVMGAGVMEPLGATGKPARSVFFMNIQPHENWGDGMGIRLSLSFTETGFPGPPDKNNNANYGIVSADIEETP